MNRCRGFAKICVFLCVSIRVEIWFSKTPFSSLDNIAENFVVDGNKYNPEKLNSLFLSAL